MKSAQWRSPIIVPQTTKFDPFKQLANPEPACSSPSATRAFPITSISARPGALFLDSALAPAPLDLAPIVVVTTVGWVVTSELDMKRVGDFSTGVAAVRMAMTGNPGLHSQQSFFFPGALPIDPTTLTFWYSLKAMTDFAYGPGVHGHQMSRQQAQPMADRISSARYTILRSEGTWYGTDPSHEPDP